MGVGNPLPTMFGIMNFLRPFDQKNLGCYCLTLKDFCRQKVKKKRLKGKNLINGKRNFLQFKVLQNTVDSNNTWNT